MKEIITYVVAHPAEVVAALNAFLLGLTAIFLLIPGEQPEKTFKVILAILEKISRK